MVNIFKQNIKAKKVTKRSKRKAKKNRKNGKYKCNGKYNFSLELDNTKRRADGPGGLDGRVAK